MVTIQPLVVESERKGVGLGGQEDGLGGVRVLSSGGGGGVELPPPPPPPNVPCSFPPPPPPPPKKKVFVNIFFLNPPLTLFSRSQVYATTNTQNCIFI